MLLPAFEYVRAESIDHATAVLSSVRNARVLAGGQTLLNALKHRLVAPDVLVDVSRLTELRGIELAGDGSVVIGAATVYAELARSLVLRERHPVAASMSGRLVDRQVRARGTIGGNVCLADPTSNWPPLLVALGASLRLRGQEGERTVPADGFVLAPYITALRSGELLTQVILPPVAADAGVGYESLQLGTDSWALARAASLIQSNGRVTSARVVLGCGSTPARQIAVEDALIGIAPRDRSAIAAAVELVGDDFDPPTDAHASSDYRRAMAKVMARRAVEAALA